MSHNDHARSVAAQARRISRQTFGDADMQTRVDENRKQYSKAKRRQDKQNRWDDDE